MTDAPTANPVPDGDWMTATAQKIEVAQKSAKPASKPRASVTPLRPLDDLAAKLDHPPIAAGPAQQDGPPHDQPGDDRGPEPDPTAPPHRDRPRRPHGEIWEGCPVRALGVLGKTQYLLDIHGQLRAETKIDAQTIMSLFGNLQHRLYDRYPTFARGSSKPQPGRFEATKAATDIFNACADRGLFNPDGAVRGVGAWADDDGNLIYHTGDRLFMAGRDVDPLTHQGRIYPAYDAIPHPASAAKVTDPVPEILDTYGTWQWSRPDIDAYIMLGVTGVQMMGGALDWRCTVWIAGPRAAGKSNLHKFLEYLHGKKGIIQSPDASKSGVTSRIGTSSLPVALDEFEPGLDPAKDKAMIDLARVASSGGQWMRGSADQKGASGNVYSSFLFSSIIIPGNMTAADISRLVILDVKPFPEGTPPITLKGETWRKRGTVLKRLLIDRWPTWQQRLDLWREAFSEHKIGGRAADNYATILAMAQMAQSADLPTPEELTGWTAKVAKWVKADTAEIGSDADEVVTHLLSQRFDPFRRGEQFTVAAWLKAAGWRPGAGARLFSSASLETTDEHAKAANRSLAAIGLRVVGTPADPVLLVATKPLQGLKDLFQRSQWAGGAWSQSLRRIKGATSPLNGKSFDGVLCKTTAIPFQSMPGLMMFDGDDVAQPAAPILNGPEDMEDFV